MQHIENDATGLRIRISAAEIELLYRIVMTANLTADDMDPTPYDFTQEEAAECADALERLLEGVKA